MSFCIGLTGGIGAGKSRAAHMFAALGAGVVDVDDISHEMTRAGGEAMVAIAREFGAHALAADGSLNRGWMRERIFQDAAARTNLEAILHPRIVAESRARVAAAQEPYVILVVPLLFEHNTYRDLPQRVVVVDCSEATQIERTMRRSRLTEHEVRDIMAAQLTRAQRLANAQDLLDNDSDEPSLRRQIDVLHARYLGLARTHREAQQSR